MILCVGLGWELVGWRIEGDWVDDSCTYLGNARNDVGAHPELVAVAIHLPEEDVQVHAPAHGVQEALWLPVWCVCVWV